MCNSLVLISWTCILLAVQILCFANSRSYSEASALYSGESYDEGEQSQYSAVTTKDFYDEEDAEQHLRQQVYVGYDEPCPPIPDLSAFSTTVCESTPCVEDHECPSDFACCFNGCIHSCLPRVQPPPPFDWLEETRVKKSYERSLTNESSSSWHPDDYGTTSEELETTPRTMSARARSGDVSLPGGCILTPVQYHDLLLFRQHQHVHSCSCSNKEVTCTVNHLEQT